MKFCSIPPGRSKGTILGHWQIGKVRADRVATTGDLSEILTEKWIWVDFVFDECANHRGRNCGRVPFSRKKLTCRKRFALLFDLSGRLYSPAFFQIEPGRLHCIAFARHLCEPTETQKYNEHC